MKKRGMARKLVGITLALSLVIGGVYFVKKGTVSKADSKVNPEIQNMLLDESNFKSELEKAKEFINANKKVYSFKGLKDVDIYCEGYKVDNPKATVVMSPGYTESTYTYEEMIYYFNKMGYNAFIIEHRGHARSGRLGADNYQTYVENFEDYVTDLNTFVNDIVKPNCDNTDLVAYAHSMGGLIVTRYLETYPDVFKKAVLSAPMHGVNTGKFPATFSKVVSLLASKMSFGNRYVPGNKANEQADFKFEECGCTSKARFDELTLQPAIDHAEIRCGGASYKWLYESYKAIDRALDKKNASKITAPILLFQVPNDTYVDSKGQDKFMKVAKTATKKVYDNNKHELYKTTNDILDDYLDEIFDFYNK